MYFFYNDIVYTVYNDIIYNDNSLYNLLLSAKKIIKITSFSAVTVGWSLEKVNKIKFSQYVLILWILSQILLNYLYYLVQLFL